MTSRSIHVAAALTVDARGRALMVRKRGTTKFMQPGGKIEPGESPLEALRRELHEELGLNIAADSLKWLGTFEADAANEPGHRVIAEVYTLTIDAQAPQPAAEIAESRWIDPHDTGRVDLAPLSSTVLLPILRKRMSDRLIIDDTSVVRAGNETDPLVLLLHGYGSNEQDLPGLMAHLPTGLSSASVRAPLNIGPGAHAWVPIRVPGRPDPQATAASTRALLEWFDAHVPPERPVIPLGFSQGGLMVTQLVRSRPQRFAAAVVLSGFVLDTQLPGDEALAGRSMPVFFGHGDADPVIVPDATERASAWFAGHTDITERSYPGLAHSVSVKEINDIAGFLSAHLP